MAHFAACKNGLEKRKTEVNFPSPRCRPLKHSMIFHCCQRNLAHQNRTIAIASDFRVDGAKSPEIPQREGVLGSEIAVRNRKSLATFHRTLKSQCSIAFSCLGNRERFLGSTMGIAIANRKNRCDFGALTRGTVLSGPPHRKRESRLVRQNICRDEFSF